MTDTFTASNGIKVDSETQGITGRRRVTFDGNHGTLVEMSAEEAVALIEFLDHEKDEELGRWRDPDNPRLTVYPTEGYETDEITILDDVDAETYTITRARAERSQGSWWHDTAKAYFEAHPERKPWEDATYKDVWVWTTADNTQEALGWVAGDGTWDIITPKEDGIKAAECPVSALVEAGFEKFSGAVTGARRTPEDAP